MAIRNPRHYELFETKWIMMRQNPGGKSAYLQGFLLGFTGTVDITKALDKTQKGIIKLKIGNGEVQTKVIDFTASTPKELTPQLAVTALNADGGFTGCTFSVDSETNRLKLAPEDAKVRFVQIYGDLAGALQFGDCRFNEGRGLYLWPSFDNDLKSVAETEQWDEDTVITNESPIGTPVKYTIPGKRTGTQFVITDRLDSRAAKQMLNRGRWIRGTDETPDVYEPPTPNSGASPKVDLFTYSCILEKYSNTEGDEVYVRERMYIGATGRHIRTGGAGSMTDGQYTVNVPDYKDDDGNDHASPRESDYTKAQWDALQMSDVIVLDWENA